MIRAAAAATVVPSLCACETTRQQTNADFHPPKGTYQLIVMKPDVTAGLLTAGGIVEPRDGWTNQARDNVIKAVEAQETKHGAVVKVAATAKDAGWDPAATEDLVQRVDGSAQTTRAR